MDVLLTFAGVLACFHLSEFALACVFTRFEVSWKSWLFSTPYCCAMAASLLEYGTELGLMPALKQKHAVSSAGLVLVVCGETIRKAAILQARHNFTHRLAFQRREGHVLVTTGVYRLVRHPGYLGWMLWAIGTQVLLVNPLCTCAFALVSWHFFRQRITFEEAALRQMFGSAYESYAQCTSSGIPFTK